MILDLRLIDKFVLGYKLTRNLICGLLIVLIFIIHMSLLINLAIENKWQHSPHDSFLSHKLVCLISVSLKMIDFVNKFFFSFSQQDPTSRLDVLKRHPKFLSDLVERKCLNFPSTEQRGSRPQPPAKPSQTSKSCHWYCNPR